MLPEHMLVWLKLVLPAALTAETLMIAILDYLRGVGTQNPSLSPLPIGVVCLPCSVGQLLSVVPRAAR